MNDGFSADDLPRKPDSTPVRGPWPVDLAHTRAFRIGTVEVRPATREVVNDQRREMLEPKVMEVLVVLAAADGAILSRDDLISACWGGRAVTDDAVNRVISRLRALARDFGGFEIETITKVGYRLVADGIDAPTRVEPISQGKGFPRRTLIAGSAAAAAAVVAAGWLAWDRYGAGSHRPSIAVLPFANLSGDPGRQYFADGMAEELRTALARINRLKVIGRTSSESVRNMESRAAAEKLGVAHVLLGSIRQTPSTVRVSAQLVDGADGVALWSETYDRPPGDVLAIQSDIARNVAQALVARLAPDEQALLSAGGTTSAAAHDLMLKALALDAESDTEEAQRRALGFLDAAIALDPQYAEAHATRSFRLAQVASYYLGSLDATRAMLADAAQAARRGVALAPNLASAHSALGWALQYELRFAEALEHLERSYRLGRGDARTIRVYATALWRIGRIDEARKFARESAALDPLHPRHRQMVAQIHLAAGRYAEAADTARQTLHLAPTRIEARYLLAVSLMLMGRTEEALAAARQLPDGSLRRLSAEAMLLSRAGNRSGSDRAVAAIRTKHGDLAGYELAEIHAQRGEKDQALALLTGALRNRDPDLARIAGDRLFDSLRGDARFRSIIARLRLPP